jgi:predicted MFS family arabinose efflux permease
MQKTTSSGQHHNYKYFVLFMLGLVGAFNFIDRAIFSVLAVTIKEDLQLTDTEIGMVGGIGFALFYALMGIPLARLADKGNRISILSLCLVFWSLATAACGLATNFWQLLIARVGVGGGEAGCFPASFSILSDYFEPSKRAFAIGLFYFAGFLGFAIGLGSTGVLAESIGWRYTFIVVGLPGVLLAITVKFFVKEPKRSHVEISNEVLTEGVFAATKKLFEKHSFRHLIIGYTFFIFSSYAFMLWLPQFYHREHGLDSSEIGIWFGLSLGGGLVVGTVLGAIFSTKLIKKDRAWELKFPALISLLAFVTFLFVVIFEDYKLSLVASFFGGIMSTAGLGANFSAVQSLSEPKYRALSSALMLFFSAILGQGLGPTLTGIISDLFLSYGIEHSLKYSLLIILVPFLLSAVHNFWGSLSFSSEVVVEEQNNHS